MPDSKVHPCKDGQKWDAVATTCSLWLYLFSMTSPLVLRKKEVNKHWTTTKSNLSKWPEVGHTSLQWCKENKQKTANQKTTNKQNPQTKPNKWKQNQQNYKNKPQTKPHQYTLHLDIHTGLGKRLFIASDLELAIKKMTNPCSQL